MPESVLVRFIKCEDYSLPTLRESIFKLLDDARLAVKPGSRVLVKPNLLMAHRLACTDPMVVVCACEWLLDNGAKLTVADSPAFGTAESVAAATGLASALRPLGLKAQGYSACRQTRIRLPDKTVISLGIGAEALDCDLILSIPRIKAHSQMRVTLAVKNCFGCITGVRKALAHARFGKSVEYFSDCIAALWTALPPVMALCDGILTMNMTGPRNGKPFKLGLLGASESAPALDAAIVDILGLDHASIPLAMALKRLGSEVPLPKWDQQNPAEFAVPGFKVPATLKDISFNPLRLARTVAKRIYATLTG